MGVYKPNASTLLYGGPGVGKSALAVSSFWDWRKREPIAKGKLITFGAEDNPALAVPEEFRRTDKGTSLRLTSPLLDDSKFLDQFDAISQRFVYDAEHGESPDVIVIDGLSEFDLLFEATFGDSDNRFAKWDGLLSQLFSMMMRLHHDVLKCHVIMTARVMEKKKGKQSSTYTPDPSLYDFDYYPSLRGSFRHHLPHYFSMVLYMDTEQRLAQGGRWDGRVVPVHTVQMVRSGEFYIKNQFEHAWLATEEDTEVVNPMWAQLWGRLTAANAQYESQYKEREDANA
jgi:hypothetical protein